MDLWPAAVPDALHASVYINPVPDIIPSALRPHLRETVVGTVHDWWIDPRTLLAVRQPEDVWEQWKTWRSTYTITRRIGPTDVVAALPGAGENQPADGQMWDSCDVRAWCTIVSDLYAQAAAVAVLTVTNSAGSSVRDVAVPAGQRRVAGRLSLGPSGQLHCDCSTHGSDVVDAFATVGEDSVVLDRRGHGEFMVATEDEVGKLFTLMTHAGTGTYIDAGMFTGQAFNLSASTWAQTTVLSALSVVIEAALARDALPVTFHVP